MAETTTKTKAQLQEENNQLNQALNEMQKQMDMLMEQMKNLSVSNTQSAAVVHNADITSRKIDVISLCANPARLSTEKYGAGVQYDFNGYGTVRKIKFTDLERIVHTTKNIATDTGSEKSFFERGVFYICDSEVVEELGLDTYYEEILDKSKIDEMIALESPIAIQIFKGANDSIKEEVIRLIIDEYNKGRNYDRNYLSMLSNEANIDIVERAEALKKATKKINK